MILVDTSVIVEFWQRPVSRVREMFEQEQVFICGVARAELLHGAKSEQDAGRIERALRVFKEVEISPNTWPALGQNLFRLRIQGVRVPFQDGLVATVAMQHNLEVWAYDRHFTLMAEALPDLRLFDEAKVQE